ncbi:uncharacterized protein LOC122870707 [Siniperca chuatsi]|uniref:uncharacterized protein LOC122870707 n=1 Tax=Siniperca chuatsi TaxID=119488 RepID=UPI001CE08115|nr:uncharacterized protein LOC122870707 [Siniperca chuatsi]
MPPKKNTMSKDIRSYCKKSDNPGSSSSTTTESTCTQPGGATASQPDGATASQPDGATASRPGGATASRPDGATASRPGGATASRPDGATASRPGGATRSRPGGATASLPGGATRSRPGGATASLPGGATASRPGGATASLPGGATASRPDGATASLPGGATASRPDRATASLPGGATASQTFTHSQVKKENDGDSKDGHLHHFNVKFSPDCNEFTISYDQPCTVLEALKLPENYNEKMKNFSDENIVIQLGKGDRASIVATHFPCSFISDGESLIISCKSEMFEEAQDRYYQPIHSRDKYSVFYIDTVGGINTKTKKLFRSNAVKDFKYLCVYGEKGMTVKETLKRDGRFIDLGDFTLSDNKNPTLLTGCAQKVDNLDQKEFKIRLPLKKKANDKKTQKISGASNNAQHRCGTTAVLDVVHQRGISVSRAVEKSDRTNDTEEIYQILRQQFPVLKELMESRFPGDSYQEALNLRKEDFGKIQQSFSEVHRVRKLLKLGESVCKVVVVNLCEGTGFVLFDNVILTNAHLFKDCVEEEKLKAGIDVLVLFNHEDPEPHANYYYFQVAQSHICNREDGLDYAILELNPEGQKPNQTTQTKNIKVPPGLLKEFGSMPLNGEACIIGHPAGGVKKMDPTCIIEIEKREQAVNDNLHLYKVNNFIVHPTIDLIKHQGIKNIMMGGKKANKVVTYNTFMYHGSSGSPVFDAHGKVFGLHTAGLICKFPNHKESVIEFAQPLLTIFEHFVSKLKESRNEDLLKRVEKEAKSNKYLKEVLNPKATDADESSDSDESMETDYVHHCIQPPPEGVGGGPEPVCVLSAKDNPGSSSSTTTESTCTQPGGATASRPGGATGSQTVTHSQVKKENDGDSTDGHLHHFNVKFSPDCNEFTISYDQPCTVLEALKLPENYNEKMKNFSDENIVIQLGKGDRASIVATHFPCSFISDGESLIISCKSEMVEEAQDRHYQPIHSRDKYSVFYIDTVGGKNTKTKKLFRSNAVKDFKYLCVYGEKGMTVKETLKRDGRFIDLPDFTLSDNKNPTLLTGCAQKVDNLDQKEFKIRLPRKKKAKDKNQQKNSGASNNAQHRCGTTAVLDVVHQRGVSVRRAVEKSDRTNDTEEIYQIFKNCVEEEKLKAGIDVFVLFNHEDPEPHANYYYFQVAQSYICNREDGLDYAILELNPEGQRPNQTTQTKKIKVPPGLLKEFGSMPPNGEACIIGHPAGGVKNMDPICIIETEKREQAVNDHLHLYKVNNFIVHPTIDLIKDQSIKNIMVGVKKANKVVTCNTFMYHGSSGSPVFDAHGKVFGLHTAGFVYEFPNLTESVIEFAQPLLTIFEHFVSKLKESRNEDLLKRVDEEAKENSDLKEVLSAEVKAKNLKEAVKAEPAYLSAELKKQYRRCRASAKLKARKWRYKPCVPSILMGNVNSLPNKSEELEALVKNQRAYRECSLMCFTETWLNNNIPDSCVDLPGFSMVRADRDARASGKNKGGGLVLFVNNRWCNPDHIIVKEKICCQDIELLAVGLRPYYVPREFSHIIVIVVYIPPRARAVLACDVIHEAIARIQTQHPDAFIAISGDFNHVTLTSHLTGFTQFVDCPTRENKTLDLLYANVKESYIASALPPLGRSDHNLVFLQPCYKPFVLRHPAATRSFRKWSPKASESLRDCFECTDWKVLLQSQRNRMDTDINSMVDCTTDYINFCRDTIIPARTVHCFPTKNPGSTVTSRHSSTTKRRPLGMETGSSSNACNMS